MAVMAGVLGALVACRHEPTLDQAVQRSAGTTMVQPPDVSARVTCTVTEGMLDAEARLVCRRQCLVETSLHAQVSKMDGMFRGADGGSLLGSTPSVAMIPMLDGGVRWLTVTPLADGGTRCEDRAAR